MRYFPTTKTASLGGSACADRYDRFASNITFTSNGWKRREHVPDFVEILRAELVVAADSGPLEVEFPRGRRSVGASTEETRIDVGDLIAVGRHTYAVYSPEGADFHAQLDLVVRRPAVDVTDDGYVASFEQMQYAHKLRLEDDRNAQRVGRFETWVKVLPDDPAGSEPRERISLDGTWRFRHLPEGSIEDLSVTWLDDGHWDTIELPAKLEETVDQTDGYYWFRTRVVVPDEWKDHDQSIRFRCHGADDEAYVFVNGHEVGYNGGWHRPFQFDVGTVLDYGVENVIAVRTRIRKPRFIFHDGGITYTFVKPYALNAYPEKTEPLGGIFGSLELARGGHAGAVRWFPRFHPGLENDTVVTLGASDGNGLGQARDEPLAAQRGSAFEYRPPSMTFRRLAAGKRQFDVSVLAGYDTAAVYFLIIGQDAGPLTLRINERTHDLKLSADTGVVAVRIAADRSVCSGDEVHADYERQVQLWEEHVYGVTLPENLTPVEAAYVRSLKQTLTLVSKTVDGEISGLFTDLIKYPIFWLRDAAISIPGTLYGGAPAHRGAVEAAGELYSRSKENANYTILYPDGTMKPQQRADDAPPLAVYSIYKAWCYQGTEWLTAYFPTVVTYLDYLDAVEREFGNDGDGMIRSSDGDWWDYKYDPRYEREGAAFFVNVLYLRALKYGAIMAEAVDDTERHDRWTARLRSGVEMLNRPVSEGGLLLPDRGYFADTVTRFTDTHPNGYHFPDDMDSVTIMDGFRPLPHSIALSEGFVQDADVRARIVELIDTYPVLRPFPGLVQYPWYDFAGNEGIGGEYETTIFRDKWKALPGNQATGGRWHFAAGLIAKALWQHGAAQLGGEAFLALAQSTTLARHPARTLEDTHSSGLFRNEAGSALDPEGFYYNWGAAAPLEGLVEGKYGITPMPGGVRIVPRTLHQGQGITKVPIPGGSVSLRAAEAGRIQLSVYADTSVVVLVERENDVRTEVTDEDGHPVGERFTVSPPGGSFTILQS